MWEIAVEDSLIDDGDHRSFWDTDVIPILESPFQVSLFVRRVGTFPVLRGS